MEDIRPKRCTACGSTALEEGFMYMRAHDSDGIARWVAGPYARNEFTYQPTNMKRRQSGQVVTYRCRGCSHLEQYVLFEDDGW